ncbi:MAG: sigma-70 family RNA polymerase sigma factor [Bacteroidota bacterium]|nr:sigma-70 family RNA polymerase sigma factor [Bacteroidota bacterium]
MKTIELTDLELVNEFIGGNEGAIEVLVRRYKNKVYTYIYLTVRNQHLAEDLFQDTFVKVIKSLQEGKYQDNGRLLPWIMRIAHNLIIDHYRREKQLNTFSNDDYEQDLFNSVKFAEDNVEQQMVYSQVLSDVRRLIDQLPPDQKEIILLRHYGDLSFKEIADQTNVSINTALGRMRYALINMRRLIKEHDICLSVK